MTSSLTLNSVQYSPVSTSCVNAYNAINGSFPQSTPAYFNIRNPDGSGTMSFIDGGDGKIHLTSGNPINFQTYAGDDVYDSQNDYTAFFKDGNSSLAMRHMGGVLYLNPFISNNYDFAWYLEPEGNGYNLFNDYNGGVYLGYDSSTDQLIIGPASNKVTWLIDQYPAVDPKSQQKALAFMNRGQGEYNSSFQELQACVYPPETLNLMNLNGCVLKQDGNVINTNFVPTLGLPINIDPTDPNAVNTANQDILQGKTLFPSQGCAITTAENNTFTQGVQNSGQVIDSENQKILNMLRKKISQVKAEIKDLRWVQVPNQQNILNGIIDTYETTLADCNYHIWLKSWLNDVGLPWAQGLSQEWINAISTIQNDWNDTYNEGTYWENVCKEAYGVALFFEDCNFQGARLAVPSIAYDSVRGQIDTLPGNWNDIISAIIVPPGLKVTIWEDPISAGTGQTATVNGAVACLIDWKYSGRGGNWNDQISGIKVEGTVSDMWNFVMPALPPDSPPDISPGPAHAAPNPTYHPPKGDPFS